MSMSAQDTKEIFLESKKNIEQIFDEINETSPKQNHSLVKLQQEYVEVWKNMTNSVILLEREYANQAGFLRSVPNFSLQIIYDMIEVSIQAYLQQNKFSLDIIDNTKQAFITFNENTKSFFSLNKEIMAYLIPMFEHKLKI